MQIILDMCQLENIILASYLPRGDVNTRNEHMKFTKPKCDKKKKLWKTIH